MQVMQNTSTARDVNPRTGQPYTLIDANRIRRSALDVQARCYHDGILSADMLAHAAYLHKKLMAGNKKVSTQ